jgi:mannitol/fructose-specific phosphotransferase system IIA component (Ntr-type)
MIENVLSQDRIAIDLQVQDWRDLVDQVGEIMVAAGDVQPQYIEAMKQVIEEMGTYCVIAPGVVLLHARPESGVNRVCVAIATLECGVNFGCENDPVRLAIGLGAVDHESHIDILRRISTVLADSDLHRRLLEATSKEDVLGIFGGPDAAQAAPDHDTEAHAGATA